ncbi:hypothetical protein CH373_09175 [Leptospira perolatii]|uniref:Uncharacterized protein n=1 Tax=Leptospira perolatii TaxID=2023191 RepID=A0A2M9ZNJ8_9LEPT|nr:hypothetical protein CH360_10320 [Leptospira perolatii]PJZ73646.1 hypothetical protein CH373_09175 [Leptospira perolatii]
MSDKLSKDDTSDGKKKEFIRKLSLIMDENGGSMMDSRFLSQFVCKDISGYRTKARKKVFQI